MLGIIKKIIKYMVLKKMINKYQIKLMFKYKDNTN